MVYTSSRAAVHSTPRCRLARYPFEWLGHDHFLKAERTKTCFVLWRRLTLFRCCCAKLLLYQVVTHIPVSTFVCKAPLCLPRKQPHLPCYLNKCSGGRLPQHMVGGAFTPKRIGGAFTVWPARFSHFCFDRGRLVRMLPVFAKDRTFS